MGNSTQNGARLGLQSELIAVSDMRVASRLKSGYMLAD